MPFLHQDLHVGPRKARYFRGRSSRTAVAAFSNYFRRENFTNGDLFVKTSYSKIIVTTPYSYTIYMAAPMKSILNSNKTDSLNSDCIH